jgi:hypothetical protein
MMRCCLIVLAACVICCVARAAIQEKPPTASRGGGSRSNDLLQTLKMEVDDAEAAYHRATERSKAGGQTESIEKLWLAYTLKADENIPKALRIVRKAPRSAAAFAILKRNSRRSRSNPHVQICRNHGAKSPG